METTTKATYEQQVDTWVREAVTNGATSFDDIVCALPGVYPTVVAASADRLKLNGFIEPRFGGRLRKPRQDYIGEARHRNYHVKNRLPVPHPLDFDWRFTTDTTNRITHVCRSLGRHLLCLGTPSVFVRAKTQGNFQSVRLIDGNAEMVRCLRKRFKTRILHHDVLQDELPKAKRADVVLMDPPWYLEYLQEFLWVASKICVMGGSVVACVPSEGTRPEVNDELETLRKSARRLGLSLIFEKANILRYQTPPFEFNALRASGIEVRSDWRKGSLWILRKVSKHNEPRACRGDVGTAAWLEASVYGTRFRFRKKTGFGFNDPTLGSIIDRDVLPSVSRRNQMRDFVDVWTSGNRVFSCYGTDVLHQIATAIEHKADAVNSIQNQLRMPLNWDQVNQIENAAAQIKRLAILEFNERRSSDCIGQG